MAATTAVPTKLSALDQAIVRAEDGATRATSRQSIRWKLSQRTVAMAAAGEWAVTATAIQPGPVPAKTPTLRALRPSALFVRLTRSQAGTERASSIRISTAPLRTIATPSWPIRSVCHGQHSAHPGQYQTEGST